MKEINKIKKNKIMLLIIAYLILWVIIFGVSRAKIYGAKMVPFGIGIVFALLQFDLNGYILALIYFSANSVAGLSVLAVFESLNVSVILCIIFTLKNKKNIRMRKWILFVGAGLAEIVYVLSNIGDAKDNLALIIVIILTMLFLYSCIIFCNGISNKYGGLSTLNIDEKICGSVILLIFMYGMSATPIWIVNLGLILGTLIILISTYCLPSNVALFISVLLGVAYSIWIGLPIYISLFVVILLASLAFKSSFKYFSAIATIIVYLIYLLLFNAGISYGELLSVTIGCFIFCLVPISAISKSKYIFDNKYNVSVRNVLHNTKKQIIKRVQELSLVFGEMENVYKDMVRGTLNDKQAKLMLKEELVSSKCSKCNNYDMCYRATGNFMENSIDTVIDVAYDRGKVLLMDLPQHLSSNCININDLIFTINKMVDSYLNYTTAITNLDSSRMLIANQLGGVSKLLQTLSKEVDVNINFDNKFDEKIKEELSFKNIQCYDVAVYEKDIQTKIVNLIVNTQTIVEKVIEKVVSKIFNCQLAIVEISPSDYPGASVITLMPKPNYDVAYGCSTITKSGKICSGDSKSLIKIDDGKYMVSICDGMGSGKKAYNISNLTISLIEKFYLAGFDNETIINSVNKLLSLTEEENFSTIDLCIIDGKKNTYDFIKLGATCGFLKRDKGECEIISSSGLPVGVLEEISPHIIRKKISPFDMLVLVSDGITDSFEGKIELSEYIQNNHIINPLSLSKDILNKALDLNGGVAIDDMTVICVRVFSAI